MTASGIPTGGIVQYTPRGHPANKSPRSGGDLKVSARGQSGARHTTKGGGSMSSAVEPVVQLRFEPPRPGSWEIDAVHFPRPVTRYWAELHPAPFERGF